MDQQVRKILVVRFSSLGDLILTTPFFREVKKLFPQAEVHFLTSSTFAPLFEGNPHIDKQLIFDRSAGAEEVKRWALQIGFEQYDLLFDLHRSLRSRLLLLKALGPFSRRLIPINKRSLKRNLLLKFGWDRFDQPEPQRLAYLATLKGFAKTQALASDTELFPSTADHQQVEDILREKRIEGNPLICLGPSASFDLKCWPKERFLALGLALYDQGYQPLSLGAASDLEPVYLEEASDGKIINLAGQFSFLQSAAMLKKARLSISNDSAVVHFSEAVGTPSIALFGPTVAQFGYAPFLEQSQIMERDLGCRPCSRNGKGGCTNPKGRLCMEDITADQVVEAALKTLG